MVSSGILVKGMIFSTGLRQAVRPAIAMEAPINWMNCRRVAPLVASEAIGPSEAPGINSPALMREYSSVPFR